MYNKQISGFTKLDINLSSGLYLIKILNKQNQFIVSKNIEPKAPVKEITKTEKNIVKINKPVDKSQMDLFKYD